MTSNCPLKFVCSKKWSDLRVEAEDSGRRFCTDCNKPVYLCQSEAEFEKRRSAGECVALAQSDQWKRTELLGLPGEAEEYGSPLFTDEPLVPGPAEELEKWLKDMLTPEKWERLRKLRAQFPKLNDNQLLRRMGTHCAVCGRALPETPNAALMKHAAVSSNRTPHIDLAHTDCARRDNIQRHAIYWTRDNPPCADAEDRINVVCVDPLPEMGTPLFPASEGDKS